MRGRKLAWIQVIGPEVLGFGLGPYYRFWSSGGPCCLASLIRISCQKFNNYMQNTHEGKKLFTPNLLSERQNVPFGNLIAIYFWSTCPLKLFYLFTPLASSIRISCQKFNNYMQNIEEKTIYLEFTPQKTKRTIW